MEEDQDGGSYERMKVKKFGTVVTEDTPQFWFYKLGPLVEHAINKIQLSHIIFQINCIML